MVTQQLWIKLQTIATCSEGVFCSGTITNNQIERVSLNQIIVDNKNMFKILRKGRVAIYQLTGIFYSRYRLPFPKSLFYKLSEIEILRRCLWSAFIIENDIKSVIHSTSFRFNGRQVILDSFVNDDEFNCDMVLTSEDRYGYFAAKGKSCLIPSSCMGKWVRRIFAEMFIDMGIKENLA